MDRNNNKKVLVTGGAGFIGSHLCDRLIKEEYQVLCIDNLLSGSMDNICHLISNKKFSFMNHDVISPVDIVVTLLSRVVTLIMSVFSMSYIQSVTT